MKARRASRCSNISSDTARQSMPLRIEGVTRGAIAARLQSEALALGADLIVAGAFGHPRLWEKMLGGVTNDLIGHMNLPVFMSH
jgi:nucleotide-binding universal stress UspA family protein